MPYWNMYNVEESYLQEIERSYAQLNSTFFALFPESRITPPDIAKLKETPGLRELTTHVG